MAFFLGASALPAQTRYRWRAEPRPPAQRWSRAPRAPKRIPRLHRERPPHLRVAPRAPRRARV